MIWDGGKSPRFGIVSTGKAYMDVLQALSDLGITQKLANQMWLALYKIGMSWPVEPQGLTAFASTVEQIFVVEEKRSYRRSNQNYPISPEKRPKHYWKKMLTVIVAYRRSYHPRRSNCAGYCGPSFDADQLPPAIVYNKQSSCA